MRQALWHTSLSLFNSHSSLFESMERKHFTSYGIPVLCGLPISGNSKWKIFSSHLIVSRRRLEEARFWDLEQDPSLAYVRRTSVKINSWKLASQVCEAILSMKGRTLPSFKDSGEQHRLTSWSLAYWLGRHRGVVDSHWDQETFLSEWSQAFSSLPLEDQVLACLKSALSFAEYHIQLFKGSQHPSALCI